MAKAEIRRKPVPANDALTQALAALQKSEAPFYEGIELLKLAKKQCGELLANRNRHAHAMRALNIMAASRCEVSPTGIGHKTCNEAIEAGDLAKNERCWPCYARHVLAGGAP